MAHDFNREGIITVYHGSTENLSIIVKGSCVSATPHLAACYAQGRVPSSKGYGQPSGWIYKLEVVPSQLCKRDVDWTTAQDIAPIEKIAADSFKSKSAEELLEGKPF